MVHHIHTCYRMYKSVDKSMKNNIILLSIYASAAICLRQIKLIYRVVAVNPGREDLQKALSTCKLLVHSVPSSGSVPTHSILIPQ